MADGLAIMKKKGKERILWKRKEKNSSGGSYAACSHCACFWCGLIFCRYLHRHSCQHPHRYQSAAPWGTETVKETRAYYDGAYWRVPAGWYHYQPTKDVWKDLLVSNSEDYFTDYYVAVWKKADGGYELAGQIGDVAHQVQGSTSVSICWNKDVDYYIQIVSDSKRNISTGCQLDT